MTRRKGDPNSDKARRWKRAFFGPDLDGVVPCAHCGALLTVATATMDHIVPVSDGGTGGLLNIAIACSSCNWQRGSREFWSFREWRRQQATGAGPRSRRRCPALLTAPMFQALAKVAER